MDKYEILSEYFGYSSFRPGQEKIIDLTLSGRDTVGIMPTGAGKSICFQVPALIFGGVTIVVSPLISLMKDQVSSLCQCGVKAAFINGSLSQKQLALALSRMEKGFYKIVYVAPERLETRQFLQAVRTLEISFVCVDEAHCVSQWGKDFRPSYLLIDKFIKSLPKRPVVCALTATATSKVRNDIINLLGLENPDVTVLSFDRKNLSFSCIRPESKPKELRKLLNYFRGKSGIVYCSSRKNVESLFEKLSLEGYSVAKYHAGMDKDERKRNQELFITDEKEIIIATNAFGMGIDKSNVSFVIHYNMPGDIESYYQEAGRAGRDGNDAHCILMYNKVDINTQLYFIENSDDNRELSQKEKEKFKKVRFEKLSKMIEYTACKTCLRQFILEYFGESSPDFCGNCSVCKKEKFLYSEPSHEVKVKKIADASYDNDALFERLRVLRKKIADEQGVPAFVVFTDATLKAMAKSLAQNETQLLEVPGVGRKKLEKYGCAFLREINLFISES